MIEKIIFYSWQSNSIHEFNWKLIEKSLFDTIHLLNLENKLVKYKIDYSTRELPGSPDIVDSIFKKIEKSSIFIADITPIIKINEMGVPNPNVLIELGYAVKVLGWDNIICICNTAEVKIENLPFDIKQRRITKYSLNNKKNIETQNAKLISIFVCALPLIIDNQAIYDKITILFKTQIDEILLSISNHFNSLFNIKSSVLGLDVFYDVIYELQNEVLKSGISVKIKNIERFLDEKIKELSEISKHPLLIINKKIDQITTVISLAKSLELLLSNISSGRFYDLNIDKEKNVELKEIEILNMLLCNIGKNIDDIIDVWGGNLLISPSCIKLHNSNKK